MGVSFLRLMYICSLEQKAAKHIWHAHQSLTKEQLDNGRNRRLQAMYLQRKRDILLIS
jgi:hypothetical protein